MFKQFLQFIMILLIILIVVSVPTMIVPSYNQGKSTIEFHPMMIYISLKSFLASISDGELGTYRINGIQHSVIDDIRSFTKISTILLFFSLLLSILFSVMFGIFLYYWKITKIFRGIINFFSIIPDFILILLSISFAVEFYKWTNIRVITLSPFNDSMNLWFPILILSLMPTFYLFKMISAKYVEITAEDYIRTAVGKGLGRQYINVQHVLKNINPFIFADMKKAISLTIGNLFIIEYLFNIKGLTIFIFSDDYQFQKVFLSVLILLAVAGVCYIFIRLLFYLIEKVFING